MALPAYPGMPSLAEQWREGAMHYVDFSEARDNFFERARIALDNDGTKR
ncbi:hypothetical protein BX283_2617 [Streptomyces sp. TLI_146]|nr:hypothetical protein BX283_2617 [Streptomyces sp. TLI_146]